MKRSIYKIPLYLGLTVFILSILFTSFRLRDERNIARIYTQAQRQVKTKLSLTFTPPDIINVVLNASKAVAGIDVTLAYDSQVIDIDRGSLFIYPSFKLLDSTISERSHRFSFSASSLSPAERESFVLASFRVVPRVYPFELNDDVLEVIPEESGVY